MSSEEVAYFEKDKAAAKEEVRVHGDKGKQNESTPLKDL